MQGSGEGLGITRYSDENFALLYVLMEKVDNTTLNKAKLSMNDMIQGGNELNTVFDRITFQKRIERSKYVQVLLMTKIENCL